MRKPEEYYVEIVKHSAFNDFGKFQKDVLNAIKQAQIEAIDETVKMCAENVRINDDTFEGFFAEIDYNSILQVADKLKKELE